MAAFRLAITMARLPKARLAKIRRGTIKKVADGEPWTMPATIDEEIGVHEGEGAGSDVAQRF